MLVLISASRFDTRLGLYVGAALLSAGFTHFAVAQRRVTRRSGALLLPAALVCFSLIQYLTALHGYAVSLYLIVAAVSAALLALLVSENRGRV